MTETLLYDFLSGQLPASQLGPLLLASRIRPDTWQERTSTNYRVVPMPRPRPITPKHLERFIDGLEAGALTQEHVAIACFLLQAAPDRFLWNPDSPEGERVATALSWLGMPEINSPLDPDTLTRIRQYLQTGEGAIT